MGGAYVALFAMCASRCWWSTRCCFWVRERAKGRERSRNVAWNQWFHQLRSYRGLAGAETAQSVHPAAKAASKGERRLGWASHGVGEGTLGAGEGAEDETNKSKFAKRTWNVRWNQGDRKLRLGRRRVKGGPVTRMYFIINKLSGCEYQKVSQ